MLYYLYVATIPVLAGCSELLLSSTPESLVLSGVLYPRPSFSLPGQVVPWGKPEPRPWSIVPQGVAL